MSIYNQAGRRGNLIAIGAAVLSVVVGLAAGFALGRSSAEEPTAAAVVADLREELAPVHAGLELVPTEYAEVAKGAGGESAAVEGDLDRIRGGLDAAAPDLRVLAPDALERVEAAVEALASAVDRRAPTAEVTDRVDAARRALAALPGGR
jgi:hypothetical protein